MAACRSLCKLTVAVRLELTNFSPVILSGRSVFGKVLKRALTVPAESLCQDQPALRLGEDSGVLFCPLIVDHRKSAVEGVRVIRRIHQHSPVFCVESL